MSARKRTPITIKKPPEGINRRGSTRAGDEGSQSTGVQDTIYFIRKSSQDRQGPVFRLRPAGEGSVLNQWRWKNVTKKGASTGAEINVLTLRAEKGEQTDGRRGVRNGNAAWVLRGQEG